MSDQKHTPGPWEVSKTVDTLVFHNGYEAEFNPDPVANCTNRADALLVAAAPEMLDSIKRVIPWLGLLIANGGHKDSVAPLDAENALAEAEALLAKVKGVDEPDDSGSTDEVTADQLKSFDDDASHCSICGVASSVPCRCQ